MNRSDAQPRDAAPSKSILAHPWFARMIGLWFAALFGLSSLALAPEVLERIVTTLGIDTILPAAAPPLGQTARLLLAMGMAGVGEIVGLLVGALLARRHPARPRQRHELTPAAAQVDAIEAAPQPDGEWLVEAEKPHESAPEPDAAPLLIPVETVAEQPLAPSEPRQPVIPAAVASGVASAPARIAAANLDELGVVQLSERLALALQARRERWADAPAVAAPHAAGNPDPGESDRALRAALASLQRISGAH
ncbi:hypothetical protein [Novosphingobium sp. Gsoil 351]|uniref:hypothetical protein n=1 Tax=Novosphingobium sp. Gsoil 351 TaxID=2675225 RepID=UPI0012B4FBFC|nr:hypothetical protein [Novosphingobium sp. Gsoil 351]QGN54727.1 hypothetical protein GKE62_09345 [Novosphingobium sp. Gsoil 351]